MLLLLLIAALALGLSGCRVRVSQGPSAGGLDGDGAGSGPSQALDDAGESAGEPGDGETEDASDRTVEDPRARDREYDESADAELVPGLEDALHAPGEGEGAPLPEDEAERAALQQRGDAEKRARQAVENEQAQRQSVDEDAGEADTALEYYTVLLQDRSGSLFECKRLNVYWESAEDHVTVYKTSPEHALILESGCYDVSSRLTEERLHVDDGWIGRKAPDVVVKAVSPDVLGGRVHDPGAARAMLNALGERTGWAQLPATRSGRVLLVSEELLGEEHLRLIAALAVAKTAYPELYGDVSMDEACAALYQEATGAALEAVFCYNAAWQ